MNRTRHTANDGAEDAVTRTGPLTAAPPGPHDAPALDMTVVGADAGAGAGSADVVVARDPVRPGRSAWHDGTDHMS